MNKICKSRKRTDSIMNHNGFGELIIIKDGAKVTVPSTCLYSTGTVKPNIMAKIECLTVENIKALEADGVKCELNVR